jgi:serpin B
MRSTLLAAALALAPLAAAHADDAPPAPSAEATARGSNDFAVDLYRRLAAGDAAGENLFFSPLSIEVTLALAHEGARGETASEIEKALHFPLADARLAASPFADARLAASFEALLDRLQAGGANELTIASSLFVERRFGLLPAFVETARARYHAAAEALDFAGAPEAARGRVNEWVSDRTRGKIQDLLPTGSVTARTRLVLANAIYFKGRWEVEFEKSKTEDAPFAAAAGPKPAPFMHRKTKEREGVRYAEDDLVEALELPYRGGDTALVILLPKRADGLADLERALTPERLAAWLGALSRAEVAIALPRFRTTHALDLVPPLEALGLRSAFSQAADFSGLDGSKDLYITGAFHKAFVDVNEEGTEAAAATGAVAGVRAVHDVHQFRADHPFIFLIRDVRSGAILFMGRLADPTA